MENEIILVKVGGSCLQDNLMAISQRIKENYQNSKVIFVHGFGKAVQSFLSKNDVIREEFISASGMKSHFTNEKVLAASYFVAISERERILKQFKEDGINACGISASDGFIFGERKRAIRYREDSKLKVFKGDYSGEAKTMNITLLEELIANHDVVVISPIVSIPEGGLISCNADKIAIYLAGEMKLKTIDFLTDVDTFIIEGKPIERVTKDEIKSISKHADGGMYKKLKYVYEAMENGVEEINMMNGAYVRNTAKTTFYSNENTGS